MADQEYATDLAQNGDRSPRRERDTRSRSPVRMETDDRRDDRGRGPAPGDGNPGNNLHVSGLSTRVDDRDLDEAFAKYGRIQKCQVMRDPHTRDSRGFAFVTMETAEEAEAAIAGLNATELMGRTINVQKAKRGRARTPTPGAYHGPPKRDDFAAGGYGGGYRAYEPRGYGPPPSRYDDRGYAPPPRDYYRGDRYGGPPPADYGRDRYGGGERYGGDRYGAYPPREERGPPGGFNAAPMREDPRAYGGGYRDERAAPRRDDRGYGGSSRY